MAGLALSGLASGVDTSSIVDQLMAIERQSLSRLQLKSSRINARDSGLKDIQAKLSALKSAAAALDSSSLYGAKQAVEVSNPVVVSAQIAGGAPIGSTSITIQQLAKSTQRGFDFTPSAAVETITFTPEKTGATPVTLSVAAGASLADVVAQINGRSDLPVFAAQVPVSGGGSRLVLSSRTAGPAAPGANSSGFTVSASGTLLTEDALAYQGGTGASYRLPPSTTDLTSDTNVLEDVIPGVKLTLKAISTDAITISVGSPATDADAIKTKVKGFVEAYNAVVNAARGKLTEKTVPDAKTTTDALKGQLFGDSGLSSMLSGLRAAAGDAFAGLGISADQLADIGISTGAIGTGRAATGTLVLDDVKLTAALSTNLAGVRELLAGRPANGSVAAADGLAQRFESLVSRQVGTNGAIDLRLKSSESEQRRIREATTRTETRLEQREKRLRAQFAAMESALQASQTQQSWLSGQLAALNSR